MFANHPRGLFPLFFTEMWERFGFYIMIALLTLYMDAPTYQGGLGFPAAVSAQVYGLYMGFVYFTPLFGGLIADRAWGFIRAVTVGGLAMMCGNLFLSTPGLACFFVGLLLIILGNGLFKPNISTMLGNLYRDRPHLKDAGFNLFYMGINTGALAAPLVATWLKNAFLVPVAVPVVAGTLGLGASPLAGPVAAAAGFVSDQHAGFGQHYGWHYAFAAAAVGMLVSVILFRACRRWILAGEHARFLASRDDSLPEQAEPAGNGRARATTTASLGSDRPGAASQDELVRLRALFIIFGIVILFWMAFSQNGMTLLRWARDHTASFAGIDFTRSAALTKAINPGLVILLTPVLVMLWAALRTRGREPSSPRKMMLGMLLTGGCYLVMGLGGLAGGDHAQVSVLWLFSGYFLLTLGELCVSPMGLSVVSKLAPPRHGGLLMGGWFVATALGNYLAGAVAGFWLDWNHSTFFFCLVGTSALAAGILWLMIPRLEHAMNLVASPPAPVADSAAAAQASEAAAVGS